MHNAFWVLWESASLSSISDRFTGATNPLFLLKYINIISKNPWVIYLCVSLNLPPPEEDSFSFLNLTNIKDPWTSVDMVLPVFLVVGILASAPISSDIFIFLRNGPKSRAVSPRYPIFRVRSKKGHPKVFAHITAGNVDWSKVFILYYNCYAFQI